MRICHGKFSKRPTLPTQIPMRRTVYPLSQRNVQNSTCEVSPKTKKDECYYSYLPLIYIPESLINIERAAQVKFHYNFGIFLVVVVCFLFIIFLNKLFQKGRKRNTSTTLKRLETIYPLLRGKREYFFNSIIQSVFHIHILQRKAMLPATSQPPQPFYPFYMHFRPYPYDIQAGHIVAV